VDLDGDGQGHPQLLHLGQGGAGGRTEAAVHAPGKADHHHVDLLLGDERGDPAVVLGPPTGAGGRPHDGVPGEGEA
jgi:hypothetical protein